MQMIRVLVSACLLGDPVRYNGRDARIEDRILSIWQREGRVVPFCQDLPAGLRFRAYRQRYDR